VPDRLWSVLVGLTLAIAIGLAVAPSVMHPHHDPPAPRGPFAGLIDGSR
jgi:hypothetical protein